MIQADVNVINVVNDISLTTQESTDVILTTQESVGVSLVFEGAQIDLTRDTAIPNLLVETGIQGPPGVKGEKGDNGKSIQFTWSGTSLGLKLENQNNYVFTNLKGDKGDNLEFNSLTESQKVELRSDVGDTSINYANIFLNVLLD